MTVTCCSKVADKDLVYIGVVIVNSISNKYSTAILPFIPLPAYSGFRWNQCHWQIDSLMMVLASRASRGTRTTSRSGTRVYHQRHFFSAMHTVHVILSCPVSCVNIPCGNTLVCFISLKFSSSLYFWQQKFWNNNGDKIIFNPSFFHFGVK